MKTNLMINECWIDKTNNAGLGESNVYETFTDSKAILFKALQKDNGRCTGKVFIEKLDGSVVSIGWVFEKQVKYEDCNEYFTRETWVTLHNKKPKTTIEHFYVEESI